MNKLTGLLIVVSWLCFPSWTQAQNEVYQEAISKRLNQFFQATEDKNWGAVLDLTYHKLFSLVPKDQMLTMFKQMEDSGMELSMSDMVITEISDRITSDQEQYVGVTYGMALKMKLGGPEYQDSTVMNYILTSLETTYGADQVRFNRKENTFDIQANKSLLAIAPLDTDRWEFIEKNPEQEVILQKLIPEQVLKQFE